MSRITFDAEVTEYEVISPEDNIENKFYLTEFSMGITFCDSDGNILSKSEISIEDAKKLARLILL